MRITRIEPIVFHGHRSNTVLAKVSTDEGLVGYGEASLELKARTVATCIEELAPFLLGDDPTRAEHLWNKLYEGGFWKGGPVLLSAISGIEQALWDIKGKALGAPVYELLGGRCRDRIRMYGHAGGQTSEELADSARQLVEQRGLTALKFMPIPSAAPLDMPAVLEATRRVAAVRRAVGDDVDVLIEFHGMLNPSMALAVAERIAEYRPLWIEESCPPEKTSAMVEIARASKVPVATGERLFTVFGFVDLLAQGGAAIVQPDVCHCGGINQLRKIAALAEAHYVMMAPHNPNGAFATAASIQVDACISNFLIQEYTTLGDEVLKEPLVMRDGYLELPTGPGLGVEIDEEKLRRLPGYQPETRLYGGQLTDGTVRRG